MTITIRPDAPPPPGAGSASAPQADSPPTNRWALPGARAALIPAVVVVFIVAGALVGESAGAGVRRGIWLAGLAVTGLPVAWRTLRGALRGHFATDLVAMLAILAALLLGEPLAGLVVVLMQTGGEALERYAEGRASDAVRALEAMAPRTAHRLRDGEVDDIPVDAVVVGDRLLVRPGELVPCDAEVVDGNSHVDASRLTGEPVPVHAEPGVLLLSGSLNQDGALTLVARAPASESQYARIVQLVRSAQASKSPLQRLADRYAVWFTPATLLVCAATWLLTADARRVLAVLVVATPCPLILATPIAIIGGINRAARRRIIVRHGVALERLGTVTTAMFDKTGTLTVGHPRVDTVLASQGWVASEVLRLAAAVEQASGHLLARTLVDAATQAGLALALPTEVRESPGRGVAGTVGGHRVIVGADRYVRELAPDAAPGFDALAHGAIGLHACVAVDGAAAGIVRYADRVREDAAPVIADLRALGVTRVLMLSGDRASNAQDVARAVGIDDVRGDLLPEDKVRVVRERVAAGESVLMVGDGTNDAPALGAATVGIALAAHGGGITAEAADVVLLADDLTRVPDAVRISRRTLHIARQSIWVGLGMSAAAMVIAALGYIPPTVGAMVQEGIDVAVILNALRTAGEPAIGRGGAAG